MVLYRRSDITEVCNEGKAIPITVHGGPESCEMSRLPHFLGNWLTSGGEVKVSLTYRPAPHYPQEDSWYSILLEAEWTSQP
jgi:hypothetical protein